MTHKYDDLKLKIEEALERCIAERIQKCIENAECDAAAAYELGIRHLHGWHLPVNYKQAKQYLLNASAKGHILACYELCCMHIDGDHRLDVVRDLNAAQKYVDLGCTPDALVTEDYTKLQMMNKVILAYRARETNYYAF